MLIIKIDKRKHYVMVLDTETANTLIDEAGKMDMSCVLVYDCGWAIVDTKGNTYETRSFVNRDIFVYERDMMQSAYYADKIPRYVEDIRAGQRIMANTYEIRQAMLEDMERYGIKEVAAFNARFDHNALNCTQRWTTASRFRHWFPFDSVEIWDIMKMAQDVVCKMSTYKEFCTEHGFTLKNGAPRKTAEVLYRFIIKDPTFEESHTGLEDVLIESEIMWYCFRQHKPMRKALYENRQDWPPATDFQIDLLSSLKQFPTIQIGKA